VAPGRWLEPTYIDIMSIPSNKENVKRRKYDSPRRRAQAARTRRDIIDAARRLFEENGYAGTTLAAVASEAGVAVETIYRSFDGKAGLLEDVILAAVAGGADRAQVPVTERPAIRAVKEEPDARKKIALHSATQPGIHARSGPLLRALREAAAVDQNLQQALERLEQQRLNGMNEYAHDLIATGHTRKDLSQEDIRDVLWTLTSIDVHDRLVHQRQWTQGEYVEWLTDIIARLLLQT
jgi:AcrR family transcriptional regulator